MITLYSGTPGSGKSLHLAERLYNRLRYVDGVVIGNFPFDEKAIKRRKSKYIEIDNLNLTPERLIRFSERYRHHYNHDKPLKEGTLWLIIDECQILFNSREWQSKNRAAWLSFFTQHRKLGFNIYLVAQFDRMIDRQMRALIEYEVIHRKLSNFGIIGKILGALYGGKVFGAVTMWYPLKERTGFTMFIAKKKYYSLYDTFGMFNAPK